MSKNVILIKGSGFKSGKDTAAAFIASEISNLKLMDVYKGMFAWTVKNLCEKLTGLQMSSTYSSGEKYPYKNSSIDFTQEQKDTFLPEWNMTLGRMLQLLATEGMRNNFDEDIHVKAEARRLNKIVKAHSLSVTHITIIIPDWRFPNECNITKLLEGDWNLHKVKVIGEMRGDENSGRDMAHESESYELEVGHEIFNNGTLDDLKQNCSKFVNKIK